jgi:hypothetical protein
VTVPGPLKSWLESRINVDAQGERGHIDHQHVITSSNQLVQFCFGHPSVLAPIPLRICRSWIAMTGTPNITVALPGLIHESSSTLTWIRMIPWQRFSDRSAAAKCHASSAMLQGGFCIRVDVKADFSSSQTLRYDFSASRWISPVSGSHISSEVSRRKNRKWLCGRERGI